MLKKTLIFCCNREPTAGVRFSVNLDISACINYLLEKSIPENFLSCVTMPLLSDCKT